MKSALLLIAITMAGTAHAGDSLYEKNQFETREQERQRQSAENYDAYQKHPNNRWEIPPAYQGTLGGTDNGAERPGYRDYRYGSDR